MKNPDCPKCGKKMTRNGKTPGGKVRWICRDQKGGRSENTSRAGGICYTTTDPSKPPRDQAAREVKNKNPQFKRALGRARRFVVTAAQNATPVHTGFLMALKAYCEHNDAELIVIPLRYKNPTSRWSGSQANEETWDPAVVPYLYNQRKMLNKNLVLLADIKTQPTATRPLSGFESITHGESGILGHTKLQLQTVPTPQGRYPKILTTTGACTVPNYTDSKAGKKGEFHHTLGACAVDIVGGKFHLRQINADKKTGEFIDLEHHYGRRVTVAPPALGIAFGDTHRKFMDKKVERATFGEGGIVQALNPEYLVFHDLHDGYAENPHHVGNPFVNLAKRRANMHLVRDEIVEDVKWLRRTVGHRKGVIVGSNHDNFLWRWVARTDWREDPDNAEFYLETALAMVRETHMAKHGSSTPDPFRYWLGVINSNLDHQERNLVHLQALGVDESFMLADVEMCLHGDKGPNGARGTRNNLKRIGVKSIIGHAHSPGIEEGCYQTGTSTGLKLEYTSGPSSWLNTHCVVYANGKRSLINIIDGKWRF